LAYIENSVIYPPLCPFKFIWLFSRRAKFQSCAFSCNENKWWSLAVKLAYPFYPLSIHLS